MQHNAAEERAFQPTDRPLQLQSVLLGDQLWPDDCDVLVRRTSFFSVQPFVVWMLSGSDFYAFQSGCYRGCLAFIGQQCSLLWQ